MASWLAERWNDVTDFFDDAVDFITDNIVQIVRIAVPVIANMVGGPVAAAVASALTTGATGGSFEESLIAGATSYVGSRVAASVSDQVNSATDLLSGAGNAGVEGVNVGVTDSFLAGLEGGLTDAARAGASVFETGKEALFGGNQTLINGLLDAGSTVLTTGTDILNSMGNMTLKALGMTAPAASTTLTGSIAGGLTTMTLNDALLSPIPEVQEFLAQNFTPNQLALLSNEARNALSQTAFSRVQGETANPFNTQDEFNQVLAQGIERQNLALGDEVTRQQAETAFQNPNLGQNILGEELGIRQGNARYDLGQSFTGDAFQPVDDDIINSIVEERAGPAREAISKTQARGNLNIAGGQSANQAIGSQEEAARTRVGEIGQTVLGENQRDVDAIRDTALGQIGNFRLGDDLFDVTPFSEQRSSLIGGRQGTLGSDIRTSLGSEPLFDVTGAIQEAGRSQGVVSGQAQGSVLDTLAQREQSGSGTSNRNRRGLGTRGSGAF